MPTTGLSIPCIRSAVCVAAALALCVPNAWAQQKQKVSYQVSPQNTKYTQRHTLEVDDQAGHQLGIFEIHRTFPADAPTINGVKLKEIWSRGYSDYVDRNGISHNYSVYVLENGDRFYTLAHSMGQADSAGKRTTISFGEIRGGTGKFVGMKGTVKAKGSSEGNAGFNETATELEYWFEK